MTILHEFLHNVVLNINMKVNMTKMSPKIEKLREVIHRESSLSVDPIHPCIHIKSIENRPILPSRRFKYVGGDVFGHHPLKPRSMPNDLLRPFLRVIVVAA
jgi:hypothetical protein